MSAFAPHADPTGLTTGQYDATATSSSEKFDIKGGTHVYVAIASQPVSIRFGQTGDAATTATGILMPANTAMVFKIPAYATHLHYIRTGGTDGLIGIQVGFLEG